MSNLGIVVWFSVGGQCISLVVVSFLVTVSPSEPCTFQLNPGLCQENGGKMKQQSFNG